jgi:exodeoxyribonuclease VII large subunit
MTVTAIANACANRIARQNARLDAAASLLNALSPVATLRRGYSVTRVDGHAVTNASTLAPGTTIETTLANGTITSTITSTQNNSK